MIECSSALGTVKPMMYQFKRMEGPTHIRCISDAALKREEAKGHSVKGTLFM